MNDCITCGRAIRLRSMLMRFNGKQGTNHWLEPKDGGDCPCLKDFVWTKWRTDKSAPTITDKMKAKWDGANDPSHWLQPEDDRLNDAYARGVQIPGVTE